MNKAGLVRHPRRGRDSTNESGDDVKKLDVFANDWIFRAIDHTGRVCVMASEEAPEIIPIPDALSRAASTCSCSIRSTGRRTSTRTSRSARSSRSIARSRRASAGRSRTASSPASSRSRRATSSTGPRRSSSTRPGSGVAGFTLDPSLGEFLLSHPDIKTPARGQDLLGQRAEHRPGGTSARASYVEWLKQEDKATNRPRSSRYIGSLVADFHRNLLYGGVFLYPGSRKDPNGKLRLLYEAAPLAFIAEQAGGLATDGKQRILDIVPTKLHQRTPLYIGSAEDVREAEAFLNGHRCRPFLGQILGARRQRLRARVLRRSPRANLLLFSAAPRRARARPRGCRRSTSQEEMDMGVLVGKPAPDFTAPAVMA